MSIVIYCNVCFEIQQEIKRKFSITSCSHVLCESCLANSTNFCPLCKVQCKTLEISQQMPAEVKMFFEKESIKKLVQNIEKIRKFHTSQISLYHEKTKPYGKKYKQFKEDATQLNNMRKSYVEVIQTEYQIMNRLKEAYRSNKITTDLFQLSTSPSHRPSPSANFASPLQSDISSSTNFKLPLQDSVVTLFRASNHLSNSSISQNPRSASSSSLSHRSSSLHSTAGSSPATPSIAKIYPKAYAQLKVLNPVAKSISPILTERSIYEDTRKSLLESTLRHMQQVSQSKFQALHKQKRKKL